MVHLWRREVLHPLEIFLTALPVIGQHLIQYLAKLMEDGRTPFTEVVTKYYMYTTSCNFLLAEKIITCMHILLCVCIAMEHRLFQWMHSGISRIDHASSYDKYLHALWLYAVKNG